MFLKLAFWVAINRIRSSWTFWRTRRGIDDLVWRQALANSIWRLQFWFVKRVLRLTWWVSESVLGKSWNVREGLSLYRCLLNQVRGRRVESNLPSVLLTRKSFISNSRSSAATLIFLSWILKGGFIFTRVLRVGSWNPIDFDLWLIKRKWHHGVDPTPLPSENSGAILRTLWENQKETSECLRTSGLPERRFLKCTSPSVASFIPGLVITALAQISLCHNNEALVLIGWLKCSLRLLCVIVTGLWFW